MKLKESLKTRPFFVNIAAIFILVIVLVYLSLVFLKIYTHHGQSVKVPDYKGLTQNDIIKLSEKKHLRYRIIDSIYVPDITPGSVIEQYPATGNSVKQNRTVYLTIASIVPEKAPIPKLTDVSLREAQSRLENAGFKIGKVIFRPSEFVNLVLAQRYHDAELPAGIMMPKGTEVDLVVGKGLSNEKINIPDLSGLTLDYAKYVLYNLNLNTGALVYDNSVVNPYDSLNARVWKQSPDSLETTNVELGSSIDLWLTVDEDKLYQTPAEEENNQ